MLEVSIWMAGTNFQLLPLSLSHPKELPSLRTCRNQHLTLFWSILRTSLAQELVLHCELHLQLPRHMNKPDSCSCSLFSGCSPHESHTRHWAAFCHSCGTESVLQHSSRWVTSEAWNYTRKRDYLPRSYAYCLQDKSFSDPTDEDINKIVCCDYPWVSLHMSVLSWLKQSQRKSRTGTKSTGNSSI